MSTHKDRQVALSHVLWIGGGTDAGKTTIARAIAERHRLQYYNFAPHERSHIERRIAAGDYAGRKTLFELTPDELWVDQKPEAMAIDVIRGWSRRVDFVVDDLLAMLHDPLIIAEGPGFFPEVIQPLLSSPYQAIWFVPEAQFKRKIDIQRGKPSVRLQTRNPELATENIIDRDLLMAEHVRAEVTKYGLTLLEVDGTRLIEQTIGLVEQHFAPFLSLRNSS